LGAIGLILPLALGILPIFTPVAAVGLAVIIAAVHHLKYKKIRQSISTPFFSCQPLSWLMVVSQYYNSDQMSITIFGGTGQQDFCSSKKH